MDAQTEQKLMQSIYDRIYDMLTFSPSGGRTPAFNPQTTLLQLQQPGQALNPDDFADAVSPSNPNGSLIASEAFSRLVDPVPAIGATYVPTDVGIENTYGEIITTASAAPSGASGGSVNAGLTSHFNKVLAQTLQVKTMNGRVATIAVPSPLMQAYEQAKSEYDKALNDYNMALKSLDMTQPVEQQRWQTLALLLQARVDATYQAWRNTGAADIERIGIPAGEGKNGITSIIANDQRLFSQTQLAGQYPGDTPWHLSYAMPSNWNDANPATVSKLFTHYEQSSNNLSFSNKSRFVKLGGATAFSQGLFAINVKRQGRKQIITNQMHMQATNINFSLDFCLVRIVRPWLNGLLLSLGGWYINGLSQGAISTGNLDDNKDSPMKLIPVAFVVARNIKISGNFSQQDLDLVTSRVVNGGTVGLGSFQLGGTFFNPLNHKTSDLTFKSTVANQTISVPGLQIIAWISQLVPLCPPLNSPV